MIDEPHEPIDRRSVNSRLGAICSMKLVSALLALSVVLNLLLATKISRLREYTAVLESERELQIGSKVPPIVGRSVDGTDQTLAYSDVNHPTVLYIFTPQCSWSKKNVDNLRTLVENSGHRYRVIGISLTRIGLKEYLDQEHLVLPVYTDVDDSLKSTYHLGATPSTIVVSPESTVLKVWRGAYEDSIRREIERYLDVRLPGCCKDTVARRQEQPGPCLQNNRSVCSSAQPLVSSNHVLSGNGAAQ
jgi:peroxiredoxin